VSYTKTAPQAFRPLVTVEEVPVPHDARGSASAPIGQDAVWITWERQRRTVELAKRLRARLFIISCSKTRPLRYALLIWQTLQLIRSARPRVLIVQNPSMILAVTAILVRKVYSYTLVVDRHSNFMFGRDHGVIKSLFTLLSDFTLRHSDVTVVTNRGLSTIVARAGGRALVLPDAIPDLLSAGGYRVTGQTNVCFICTFAEDEPYREVVALGRDLPPGLCLYVTGNPDKVAWTAKEREILHSGASIVLTGFLPEQDYCDLLRSVDAVMDLTLYEDCLVCGAYEAVAAGKPLILSETRANRELFGDVPIYVKPNTNSIYAGLTRSLIETQERASAVIAFRQRFIEQWQRDFTELVAVINEAAGRH
jgi:glycosyltransferase involved in cell wall biosynthesis